MVDDGSTDNTAGVVQSYMKSNSNQVLLLRLHHNRGKGAALKMGVRKSNGHMILIVSAHLADWWSYIIYQYFSHHFCIMYDLFTSSQADADGATDIRDLDRLIPALRQVSVPVGAAPQDALGIVVGSR